MAYVDPVKGKAGEVTGYRVKCRLGGARDGDRQGERFLDVTSAEVFRDAVNHNARQWPPGWVKGKGSIAPGCSELRRPLHRPLLEGHDQGLGERTGGHLRLARVEAEADGAEARHSLCVRTARRSEVIFSWGGAFS